MTTGSEGSYVHDLAVNNFAGDGVNLFSGSNVIERVERNPDISPPVREQVTRIAEHGTPIVPVAEVEQAALDAGAPPAEAEAIADDYGEAQLHGLERALGAVGLFALLALWFTRALPARPLSAPRA